MTSCPKRALGPALRSLSHRIAFSKGTSTPWQQRRTLVHHTKVFPSEKEHQAALEEARTILTNAGFDPTSFWEQRIVWGDQDPFQHVNNVRYARFFESSRIKWMMSLGEEWGGPDKAQAMIKGQGVSLILQNLDLHYRRPVTYPDTLLVGYCPLPPKPGMESSPKFHVVATGYSLGLQDFVVYSKETLVWYDYDALKKCNPPTAASDIVFRRAQDMDIRTLHRSSSKSA